MEYILLLLYNVFAFFDRIIAWAIAGVYDLIITISTISVFDSDTIQKFAARINILLGLMMLFWLSMRIIKYVINPDLTSDNQQGFGRIISNVVITLAMLVLVNFAFSWMYRIQSDILSSNFLPKIVFGLDNNNFDPTKSTQGKNLAYLLFTAFIQPDSSMLASCENFYSITDDKVKLTDCYTEIKEISKSAYNRWSRGVTKTDAELLLSSAVVSARSGSSYIFSYIPVISTICGIVMLIVLVQFAVDVSVRAVKLGFLQLIAPIPIISYLDPNSGKDGIFSKWLKMVGSTFASLFIRLLALFFGVFVIMLVTTTDLTDNVSSEIINKSEHPFVVVMLIIGTLIFVKEFPKLISEITGIKNEGFKLGALGAGLATAGGVYAGVKAGKEAGVGAKGIIAGGISGGWSGFKTGTGIKHESSFTRGANTAYKHVSGNDMKHFNMLESWGRKGANRHVQELNKDKDTFENELANIQTQRLQSTERYNTAASNYATANYTVNKLQERLKAENLSDKDRTNITTEMTRYESMRDSYHQEMVSAQAELSGLDERQKTIDKHVGVIKDDIGDYSKRYGLDESPKSKVDKAHSAAEQIRTRTDNTNTNNNNN